MYPNLIGLCQLVCLQHQFKVKQVFVAEAQFIFFSRVHATLQPALSVGRLVGWSVGRLVGWSVGPLVRWSVGNAFVFSAFSGSFRITAPAQSHATDSVVYTALFSCEFLSIFLS